MQLPAFMAFALLAGPIAPPAFAGRVEGHIVQVTTDGAFLDRGTLDGLAPGTRIVVRTDKAGTLELAVGRVSDHHAFAASSPAGGPAGLFPGDAWDAPGAVPISAPPDTTNPKPPPQPVDPRILASAWERALAEPVPLRPYQPAGQTPASRRSLRPRAELTPTAVAYPSRAGGNRSYAGGILNLRGLTPLSRGNTVVLRVDCDLESWASRPHPDRLRPAGKTSALLHALELSRQSEGAGLDLSLGRTRPSGTSGVALLDGASLRWTLHRGLIEGVNEGLNEGLNKGLNKDLNNGTTSSSPIELGIYGGTLPDPLTLAPSRSRVSLGAFAGVTRAAGAGFGGSARGHLAVLRSHGISREDGHLLVRGGSDSGFAFDGSLAAARQSGRLQRTETSATLRRSGGPSAAFLHFRDNIPLYDPEQSAANQILLGRLSLSASRSQRIEAGFTRDSGHAYRFETILGRSQGPGDFDRWTAEASLGRKLRLGPLSRCSIGYRGSSGWQEGHEAELGCRLDAGLWRVDWSFGGGVVRQNLADRTAPLGRGGLDVHRPLGRDGSMDLLLHGQGGSGSFDAVGRFALSWHFEGGKE